MFDRLNDHYALHGGPMTSQGSHLTIFVRNGDYNFVIELALAGMSKDDLEVEVAEGTLTVRSVGEKEENEGGELLTSWYFISTI